MIAEECLSRIAERLEEAGLSYGHGTDNPADEAWWLLHGVLYPGRGFRQVPRDLPIGDEHWQQMQAVLKRRVEERLPLAYLLGEAWFCGLPFSVDERALVPRSPIAELIANGFEPLLPAPPERILDLCTGSGCIGIASAMVFPAAEVVLGDVSEEALALARENIRRHEVSGRVGAVRADVFDGISGTFDLIVTNPPYVSEEEYSTLPAEYRHEPRIGLVSGQDGLAIPLAILAGAGRFLNPGGVLIMEVGNSWEALAEAVPQLPLIWLEFEHGGHGVCAIRAEELPASS